MKSYKWADLADVSVVQSSVDLIEDEEGGGFVATWQGEEILTFYLNISFKVMQINP